MSTSFCRHIRTNGRRCQAYAVRGQSLCFYHHGVNVRHRALNPPDDGTQNIIHPLNLDPGRFQREPLLAEYFAQTRGPLELDFPSLDDRESIQLALSMLLNALGRNRIEPKRAAIMLYGLQVASSNARHLVPVEDNTVTETVLDESGHPIAPDEDPEIPYEELGTAARLLKEFDDEANEERLSRDRSAATTEPEPILASTFSTAPPLEAPPCPSQPPSPPPSSSAYSPT
ncbi:MAG: hypothetical protein V4555_13165 [Acidobacteriota bacterium]